MQFAQLCIGHEECRPTCHLALESDAHVNDVVKDLERAGATDRGLEYQRIEQVPLLGWLNRRTLALPYSDESLRLEQLEGLPDHGAADSEGITQGGLCRERGLRGELAAHDRLDQRRQHGGTEAGGSARSSPRYEGFEACRRSLPLHDQVRFAFRRLCRPCQLIIRNMLRNRPTLDTIG